MGRIDDALKLLRRVSADNCTATLDGDLLMGWRIAAPSIMDLEKVVGKRTLVATIEFWTVQRPNVVRRLGVSTRLKNDNTDSISVDGVVQSRAECDFDAMLNPQLELRWVDVNGTRHELRLKARVTEKVLPKIGGKYGGVFSLLMSLIGRKR